MNQIMLPIILAVAFRIRFQSLMLPNVPFFFSQATDCASGGALTVFLTMFPVRDEHILAVCAQMIGVEVYVLTSSKQSRNRKKENPLNEGVCLSNQQHQP